MEFTKFIDDFNKKRKIRVSEIGYGGGYFAQISSLKFLGNLSYSENGKFWIAYCDSYVRKKNPCYLGHGNKILLFGEGQRPRSGKVANNGTFTICEHSEGDSSSFFVLDKEGNVLIQQKSMRNCDNNAISEDGKYALCMIDDVLCFFDLESLSLKWKIEPLRLRYFSLLQGSYYRISAEKKLLFLQTMNNNLCYRYDFEGNFLDAEKLEKDKLTYAKPLDLYSFSKSILDEEGSTLSPDKADELFSLLYRALAFKEIDYMLDFKAEIYELIGEVYLTQKNTDLAIESYKMALIFDPRHIAKIYRKLGEIYEYLYETDEAILNFEMALKHNKNIGVKRKLDKLKKLGA